MMTRQRFASNQGRLEIEITPDCNIRCHGCNRSSRQAPSTEGMTVAQMERFVTESIGARWHWHTIGLLGGEPTLHPNLEAILSVLWRYKEDTPCVVELVTNGFGDQARSFIDAAPAWLQIRNSRKTGPLQSFEPYNIAPRDLEAYRDADFSAGCAVAAEFGLGLTRHGYYPCGPGASIDRVFGFDIGIKRLADVTTEALTEQMRTLCGYCGHFLAAQGSAAPGHAAGASAKTRSSAWKQAYRDYNAGAPRLSTY